MDETRTTELMQMGPHSKSFFQLSPIIQHQCPFTQPVLKYSLAFLDTSLAILISKVLRDGVTQSPLGGSVSHVTKPYAGPEVAVQSENIYQVTNG